MKRIKTFAILAALFAIATLTGCKKQNPAVEFAGMLDKITTEIEKATTSDQLFKLDPQLKAGDEFVVKHADYVLTPADKETISNALVSMVKASMQKQYEFAGMEYSESAADMYTQPLKALVENATTLGDLNGPNEPYAVEEYEEEIFEGTDAVPTDSVEMALE